MQARSKPLRSALHALATAAMLLTAVLCAPGATAATGAKGFDHLTTGFPLTGQHQSARCEDCHVRGIFKGTPAQCAACHTQGALVTAVMIPNNHFPTSEPCSTCHTTATFYGAHFPHSAVAAGTCAQCHNGVFAMGKTPNHLATSASCDVCHTTVSFTASYVAYPLGHIPTTEACSVCHDPKSFVPAIGYPGGMVHTGITTDCTVCHAAAANPLRFTIQGTQTINGHTVTITANGVPVVVTPKPEGSGHIPTQHSCEVCHSAGYAASPQTFKGGVMNHEGITSGCAACHADGVSFSTVPNLVTMSSKGTHIPLPAGEDCSTCHASVKAFGPGTAMNHAGISGNCNLCHEATGVSYYNLPNLAVRPTAVDAVHPAVGDGDCSSCHKAAFTTGAFNIPTVLPAVGHGPSIAHLPNPAGTACATCHTGVSTGISASADAAAFAQYVMGASGHAGITSDCEACHEGGSSFLNIGQTTTLMVRPSATAVGITIADAAHPLKTQTNPSGADCITCHGNTGFAPGGFINVASKPNGHIAVTGVACATCHSLGNYSSVTLPMPHAGAVTGTCASCHNTSTIFAGSVFTPNAGAGASGGTFGTQTGLNFQPKQIVSSPAVGATGGHIPLPSGDDCSTCHLSTGTFGSTSMVHTGITSSCNTCHEVNMAWYGVNSLAVRPTAIDAIHPVGGDGDCSSCHSVAFTTGAFNLPTVLPSTSHNAPTAHLPNPAGTACVTCHTGVSAGISAAADVTAFTQYVMGATGHVGISSNCEACHEGGSVFLNIGQTTTLMVRPSATAIGITVADAAHPLKTQVNPSGVDCITCHANSGFGAGGFNNVTTKPTGHIAVSGVACNTCHTGSGFNSVGLPMPHTGAVTGTCASCHNTSTIFAGSVFTPNTGVGASGGTFGTQTGLNFQPKQIVSSPAVGATGGHIPLPSGDDCSTCHLSTGTFGSTAMVHTGITTGCDSCHESTNSWYGVSNLAVRPTSIDGIHPATGDGDCSSCHSIAFGSGAFNIATVLPAVGHGPSIAHIPNPAGTACLTCHTTLSAGATASATVTAYTQYVMGVSGHAGISSDCEACHEGGSNFLNIGQTTTLMVRPSATAVGITIADAAHPLSTQVSPSGADCITCHTNTGFVAGGFNNVTTKPTGHIATSSVACTTCHTASGYTSVTLPMPHTGAVTGTCASCHNTSTIFAGSVFTPNTGVGASGGTFGTQSGLNFQAKQIVSSPAVGATGGHIPLPSGDDCSTCHLSTSAFGSTAMVHTGITGSCDSCHEVNMSWYGVNSLAVRPTAVDTLHPASGDGDCSSCHAVAFTTGAFNIPTALPAVGHGVSTAHLPNPAGTGCAVCHTGVSAGISASADAAAFANYVMGPTGHTGISASCQTCHEGGSMFLNIGQTTTLMVRPSATAIGITIADAAHPLKTQVSPSGVDCITCHTGTGFVAGGFSTGVVKPAGHINVSSGAVCSTCHTTGTTSVVLPMPHTAVVGTCASCHNTSTYFAGSTFTPSTTGSGGTFGSQTSGLNFLPRQIVASPAVGSSGGHIPLPSADDCSVCHTSTSAFGPGTAMVHTNITSGCATCHAAGSKWYGETYTASPLVTTGNVTLSPVHVPITQGGNPACEECHSTTVFTSFGTSTKVNHTSGAFMTFTSGRSGSSTPTCKSCHGPSGAKWYGVSLSTETVGSHQGSTTSQDCINCHSTSNFGGAAAAAAVAHRPVAHAAIGPAVRPTGTGTAGSSTPAVFTHVGVAPGACNSCHGTGGSATAKPASHLPTTLSCDACHRTSAWLPALFTHNGILAGSCASCHTGNWATAKPAKHLLTSRSCDTCHHTTTSWTPVSYEHLDTVYSPHPASVRCADCHSTNTEQVVWKYPNLKPGCAGCHGAQFAAPSVRRSRGPVVSRPGTAP